MASPAGALTVRRSTPDERAWVAARLVDLWGSVYAARLGVLVDASALPALVSERAGERVGLATFDIQDDACEVVTIDAFVGGTGVGSSLLSAVVDEARAHGCRRLWLITTNDNMRALRFYQRRGLRLAALHRDALALSRRLKPSIAEIGQDGIPLRDELELEMLLEPVDGA
ncbi:MAG TPA: GNAT family N-acetyltransferase [Nocardioidaceae bacterium]|jgi:ribosomal protein S18 acetylase RimI-like enzyme